MKRLNQVLLVGMLTVLATLPAQAALDTTEIVAGLADLATVVGVIVAGLITFAALWMVGKKAYRILSSA